MAADVVVGVGGWRCRTCGSTWRPSSAMLWLSGWVWVAADVVVGVGGC